MNALYTRWHQKFWQSRQREGERDDVQLAFGVGPGQDPRAASSNLVPTFLGS